MNDIAEPTLGIAELLVSEYVAPLIQSVPPVFATTKTGLSGCPEYVNLEPGITEDPVEHAPVNVSTLLVIVPLNVSGVKLVVLTAVQLDPPLMTSVFVPGV